MRCCRLLLAFSFCLLGSLGCAKRPDPVKIRNVHAVVRILSASTFETVGSEGYTSIALLIELHNIGSPTTLDTADLSISMTDQSRAGQVFPAKLYELKQPQRLASSGNGVEGLILMPQASLAPLIRGRALAEGERVRGYLTFYLAADRLTATEIATYTLKLRDADGNRFTHTVTTRPVR